MRTHEHLSDAALEAISKGDCPSCGHRGFVIGPWGGASINIECANPRCRERFNVTLVSGTALIGQSIEREIDGGSEWPSKPRGPVPVQ